MATMKFELEKSKSLQIAEILENEIRIGRLAPGARVQSVRLLAKKFAVSLKVIQIVFDILEEKKLIERRQGSGTFVRKQPQKADKRVAFLFKPGRSIEESYHFQVFQGVSGSLQQEGIAVDLTTDLDLQKLSADYTGIVVSSTIGNDTITELLKLDVPFVVYGKVSVVKDVCEVYPDYFNGSKMAIDYLIAEGYKNIYFIQAENEDNQRSQICLQGYLESLKNNGIAFDPALVWNFSRIDELIAGLEKDTSGEPLAMYVPNDATAFDINNRLRAHGISVPEKISLVGFYNRNTARFAHPPLTTVGFDHKQLGEETALALLKKLKGDTPESVAVPVELIERESVKKIYQEQIVLN
jgi:DNA-binding LacI/PurR family transcriptional regulator